MLHEVHATYLAELVEVLQVRLVERVAHDLNVHVVQVLRAREQAQGVIKAGEGQSCRKFIIREGRCATATFKAERRRP